MKVVWLILISVLASGAGQLFLRAGTGEAGGAIARSAVDLAGWLRVLTSWKILVGLALWAASTLVYLLVLSRTTLSFAFCVASLNYVLVPLAARWLFDETLSGAQLLGMSMVTLGVAVTLWARVAGQGSG